MKNGLWVPIDENGTRFFQIAIPSNDLWKLIEKVYSEIELYMVHDMGNTVNFIFPMGLQEEYLVPLSAMMANNLQMMKIGKKLGEFECTAITKSYWTCNCKTNFVHHKIKQFCNDCGVSCGNSEERLPQLTKLIKWDLIVK